MKVIYKILLSLLGIFLALLITGYMLPKEKMVSRVTVIDKMYFFVMADISGHFMESQWRSDLDTVIQQEDVDGLQVWLEKYKNGDSLLLKTIKTTEVDLVREIIESGNLDRLRVIQLKDLDGRKTAIKMTEEVVIKNPILRLLNKLNDHSADFIEGYLKDLKAKYENEPEDNMGF